MKKWEEKELESIMKDMYENVEKVFNWNYELQ